MILRYQKLLDRPPATQPLAGITIRQFAGSADIERWLVIHADSYGPLTTGKRLWTAGDFRREFQSKPTWQPEDMWFAESEQSGEAVGTVTCSRSAPFFQNVAGEACSVIRWLGVRRNWQRRGIGRSLVSIAEQHSWNRGVRRVRLETLRTWTSAVAFYGSLGYRAE